MANRTRPNQILFFVSDDEKRIIQAKMAISIGTSHGAYKFTPEQCTRNEEGKLVPPPLAFDVLDAVMKQAMSVDALEKKLGYDFFPNLEQATSASTAAAVEASVSSWWK